jgi:hypothetical protein
MMWVFCFSSFHGSECAAAGAHQMLFFISRFGFSPHPWKSDWHPHQQLDPLGLTVELVVSTPCVQVAVLAAKLARLARLAHLSLVVSAKVN